MTLSKADQSVCKQLDRFAGVVYYLCQNASAGTAGQPFLPDPLAETARRQDMDVIKVSAHSRSTAVAGAIAGVIREQHRAEVQAIGASAVNQAVKAVAIARSYLTVDGIDIVCAPEFVEIDIDGQERTAIKFIVEPRG
jgi:stage V sporulation protein S